MDWLRDRSASALTRSPRSRGDEAHLAYHQGDSCGLLASDVAETDREVVVRLEASVLEENGFSISVDRDQLVVRGEQRFERDEEQAQYHLHESAYGAFERRLPLPSVDERAATG